ncbi:MAG: L-2-hydroxyglutarate oxidase [Candidatus Eisenbacteria sp.]|nr:L-2-hydroxyglutarate oxidase [Candidatus Eisenbacteria bacterium]
MSSSICDVAIIGGGIVGAATAAALVSRSDLSLIILEAEDHLAAHQTGNNSGVIHSGLYYKPGSHKARNCTAGRDALYRFCREYGVPHERCGKIVVATRENELPVLEELECRGRANGLRGLRRLTPEEIREREPGAAGIAGLLVPDTGIVDYTRVTAKLADLVTAKGGNVRTATRVHGCRRQRGNLLLETTGGEIRTRFLINCGGLQSDRIARRCGVDPRVRIIPFRGEYYELVPERRRLVKNLIYPVPDPALPFLGAHFTRMINGGVEAGPNAVFAFKREGYRKMSLSLPDVWETFTFPAFWKMAARFWKIGIGEYYRSFSKRAFLNALRKLLPEISMDDIRPGGAGVRAQALDASGRLVDDFRIVEAERMIHVLNAPSPAATACLSIGDQIAKMAVKHFGLSRV